jgi:hypothetical protein
MNRLPQNHTQSPKEKAVVDYRNHVSSGKAAVFRKYGNDLVAGRRQGSYLCDLDALERRADDEVAAVINKSLPA